MKPSNLTLDYEHWIKEQILKKLDNILLTLLLAGGASGGLLRRRGSEADHGLFENILLEDILS